MRRSWNILLVDLTQRQLHPQAAKLLTKAVYLVLLVNTLLLLPAAAQIWGPDAYMLQVPAYQSSVNQVIALLYLDGVAPFYGWFVAGQIIFLLLGLTGRFPRITALFIWFFTINLFSKAIELSNGGYNLMAILTLYFVAMNGNSARWSPNRLSGQLRILISNLSFYAVRVQVAILYATAGLYKITGAYWLEGSALEYVLRLPEYSTPWVMNNLTSIEWLMVTGNYFVLIYQLAFPIMIWFRKVRFPVIWIGTIFHMGIAFVVGIPDFAFMVIASYFAFYPEETATRILALLQSPAQLFRQRFLRSH